MHDPILPWRSPRKILFTCFVLDLVGAQFGAVCINQQLGFEALRPPALVMAVGLLYGLFSWLFGGYTVLRWPWLRLRLVIQRLFLTALATGTCLILLGWFFNALPKNFPLLNREVLASLLLFQSVYALSLRLVLRSFPGFGANNSWQLLAAPEYQKQVLREWRRNPFVKAPTLLAPIPSLIQEQILALRPGTVVATNQKVDNGLSHQLAQLKSRGITICTIEEIAQSQLERLPPALLPADWLGYRDLRWTNELSFQRKLKRFFDVIFSSILLLTAFPLIMILGSLIWLEDRGSIFYTQWRTGWLGKPFKLYKLRTMRQSIPGSPTPWTSFRDCRVTVVGHWLRITRLDELPQLINVLMGHMSLVGPRPEQPNLDAKLEQQIPHYSKRYWMLPGMSGWAQVCGPSYPASLEEAELKLSYDLYYLCNWSIWLDFLIFLKTIKTILKVRGL